MPLLRLLIAACLLVHAGASRATLWLTDEVDRLGLHAHWALLDDPTRSLGLEEAIAARARGDFKPHPRTLGRGYHEGASWLVVDLANDTPARQAFILRLSPQMLDHVDVYWQQGGDGSLTGDYRHQPLGDHVPAAQKPSILPVGSLPLALDAGVTHRLYIRVQTTSSHMLEAELVSARRHAHEAATRFAWMSAYQAFAFGLAVITFLQGVWLRDRTHGVYGFLPLGLSTMSLGTEGMQAVLLPAVPHSLNDWLVGFGIFSSFAGLSVFCGLLFDTRRNYPLWHRYLQLVAVLGMFAFLTSGTAWYGKFTMVTMGMGTVLWVFMTWAAINLINRGERHTGWLMVAAFTLPLLAGAISTLYYLGILVPAPLMHYLLPVTSLLHMVLIKMALTERLLLAEAGYRDAVQVAALEIEHRRDKEKLIAMITHEIRNPIAVIDAANRSLQMLEGREFDAREKRYQRIERATRRLTLLMQLAETSISMDGEEEEGELRWPFDPLAATRALADLLDEDDRARIAIEVVGEVAAITGNERTLRFVWLNLIDNACKYSPKGTLIRIALGEAIRQGRRGIEWRIEDEGPGIPPGQEERIFEKYWRAGEAASVPGLGLGLYLARGIVEHHGGVLHAEPGRAKGACFTCWLPLAAAERKEPSS